MKKYTKLEVEIALKTIKKWNLKGEKIEKIFEFKNFIEALSFIVKIGVFAEKHNHHPEIYNIYNKVTITLSTNDANGLTDKDFKLASIIDTL